MKIYRPSKIEWTMILVFLVVASNGGYYKFYLPYMEQCDECCEQTIKTQDLDLHRIQVRTHAEWMKWVDLYTISVSSDDDIT